MKLSALILFFAFAAFSFEAIHMPAYCKQTKKVSKCPMYGKMNGMCLKMKGKQEKKTNRASPNCMDCPMWVVMLQQKINRLQADSKIIKKEYSPFRITNLAEYIHTQWKPPNA